MAIVSVLPHVEFETNDHLEGAPYSMFFVNDKKAPTGDEHIKNYRGWGGLDMKYIGHETPQTKGT